MLSFGSDAGGIGAALTGIFSATSKGTENCGSRPVCIGNLGNCKQKQEAYNLCVSKSMELKSQSEISNQRTKMITIVAVFIIALVALSIILKNKK